MKEEMEQCSHCQIGYDKDSSHCQNCTEITPDRFKQEPKPKKPDFEEVPFILNSAAELFKSRDKDYGSAYKKHGRIMAEFFPDGINLKTKKDFDMYNFFEVIIGKMNRISKNLAEGGWHEDSSEDIINYSAMALEKFREKP